VIGSEPYLYGGMEEAFPALRDLILRKGHKVAPRGEPTTELLACSFGVADAVRRGVPVGIGRKVGVKMMAIDGTGNLAGASYPDVAIGLAGVMDRFADDLPGPWPDVADGLRREDVEAILERQPNLDYGNRFFQGAYGPRIGDQLERVEDQLRLDPDTRQAVVSLWSETDRNPVWKDRPCTTEFQMMLRGGRLDMFVFMRANDLWTGTCYDVFQFGQVQAAMANVLGVPWGNYHHYATSLHIYDREVEKIKELRRWTPERWVDKDPDAPRALRRQKLVPAAPAVHNSRESWGPDWDDVEPGHYKSWGHVRRRFREMLESARHGWLWAPGNAVEEWYWSVLQTGRAPE
jgi:hypothetical protein